MTKIFLVHANVIIEIFKGIKIFDLQLAYFQLCGAYISIDTDSGLFREQIAWPMCAIEYTFVEPFQSCEN